MLKQTQLKPDYLFEVSWEVCNKVGGIYTVISTKAQFIKQEFNDNYILIGPDFRQGNYTNSGFIEDNELFKDWHQHAEKAGLKLRTGRWNIAGKPIVILVDFGGAHYHKNDIFKNLWENFQVDSLHGESDYIEPALFGFYCGIVIESFCNYYIKKTDKVVAQFHEWLTGAGILHLKQKANHIATVFTTHATVLARCVANSGWPFYSRFYQHEPGYTAHYFNVEAKHTLEKACAHNADCFTTVSEVTAKECRHFLYKEPTLITNNGIDSKVLRPAVFAKKRVAARKLIAKVANALCCQSIDDDALFILKSCRYEFKNKGIDVFIDALGLLNKQNDLKKTIVAFILVPASNAGPRKEIVEFLNAETEAQNAAGISTHYLNDEANDLICKSLNRNGLTNQPNDKVKVVFVPTFLNGNDGIFNVTYDDLLIGFDLTAFPSYYEPWGYTPLESLSSYIPTITTSISGFAFAVKNLPYADYEGISIIYRDDFNEDEVISDITMVIEEYAGKTEAEIKLNRKQAHQLSRFFVWGSQLHRYKEAYHLALKAK